MVLVSGCAGLRRLVAQRPLAVLMPFRSDSSQHVRYVVFAFLEGFGGGISFASHTARSRFNLPSTCSTFSISSSLTCLPCSSCCCYPYKFLPFALDFLPVVPMPGRIARCRKELDLPHIFAHGGVRMALSNCVEKEVLTDNAHLTPLRRGGSFLQKVSEDSTGGCAHLDGLFSVSGVPSSCSMNGRPFVSTAASRMTTGAF